MQWWIGQVTDPEKGEWGDALEKTRAGDSEEKDIYSHRCRVRIVGYHGCEDDLADKDYHLHMFFYHQTLQPLVVVEPPCSIKVEKL